MKTLTRHTSALILLIAMMQGCWLNHNLIREMKLKHGNMSDVVTALRNSGRFLSVKNMDLETKEIFFAYLRPEYEIHYISDTKILGFEMSIETDDAGRYLRLMAYTQFGMTCKELPAAVEFLRDCHALLLDQGIDVEPISLGQSFIDNEKQVLERQPRSVVEK